MENNDLLSSLEFLKGYIVKESHNLLDADVDGYTIGVLIERLQHAVDHIITDHCPDPEEKR